MHRPLLEPAFAPGMLLAALARPPTHAPPPGSGLHMPSALNAHLVLAAWPACRVLPGCGHAFHAACLDTWLLEKAMCPVCRAEIKPPVAGPLDPAAAAAEGGGSADALAAVAGPL